MADQRFFFTIFVATAILFSNCTNYQQSNTQSADTVSTNDDTETGNSICYLKTSGSENQDTTYLHITLEKNRVHGTYDDIPFEKDARRGTLEGSRTDDILDLTWTFMQEGMQDTLRVVFRLAQQDLLQKPLSVDENTGRQITRDSSDFSVIYKKTACKTL